MDKNEHIAAADSEGYFYCRVVDNKLNYKKEQQVCGRGCPCYTGHQMGDGGQLVCCYCDEPSLFPIVKGLDERLYKAYSYAAQAHKGQYRKKTEIPYFAHIITTMNFMLELTDDIEVLQAAILHDTVEDTWVTFDDLRSLFGDRVVTLVAGETENKRHELPASQTWEIRKKEAVESLGGKSIDVKKIVLADKTANLDSIAKEYKYIGEQVWNKFNQKDKHRHEWYFRAIREKLHELDDTSVMKIYDNYLNTLFN